MKKIAPELDRLMWYLAEEGDTRAVEEFEVRYPDQKYELARRIAMLRSLRGEGRKAHTTRELPRFQPLETVRPAVPRRMAYGVGLLSLAALAAATYTVVTFLQPAPPPPQLKPIIKPDPAVTQPSYTPPVIYKQPSPNLTVPPPPVVVDTTPKYLQPQDLKIEQAPLLDALQLIAAKGGIQLTVAEGVSNPDVRITYRGKNTFEMLQDLGKQYAFTPFDEGDGTILIIPAIDPSKQRQGKLEPEIENGVPSGHTPETPKKTPDSPSE